MASPTYRVVPLHNASRLIERFELLHRALSGRRMVWSGRKAFELASFYVRRSAPANSAWKRFGTAARKVQPLHQRLYTGLAAPDAQDYPASEALRYKSRRASGNLSLAFQGDAARGLHRIKSTRRRPH